MASSEVDSAVRELREKYYKPINSEPRDAGEHQREVRERAREQTETVRRQAEQIKRSGR